jgi:hypothetical protein
MPLPTQKNLWSTVLLALLGAACLGGTCIGGLGFFIFGVGSAGGTYREELADPRTVARNLGITVPRGAQELRAFQEGFQDSSGEVYFLLQHSDCTAFRRSLPCTLNASEICVLPPRPAHREDASLTRRLRVASTSSGDCSVSLTWSDP